MPAESPENAPPETPAPKLGRPRLSTRKKLVFAVGLVLGLILALEGGLRLLGYPRGIVRSFSRMWNPDQADALGLFRPGKHHVAYPSELAYDATINDLGLRGEPLTVEKPKGTLRILALGDSVTFGYHVADRETWPAQLQALLSKGGRKVQVVNGGCGHFSITDERRYYEQRLSRLHPDVVILQFCTNDVSEGELLRQPTLFEEIASGKATKSNFLRQTALGEFQLLLAIRLKEAARRRRGEWPPKRFPSARGQKVPDERWAKYRAELAQLEQTLAAAKIPLLMIGFVDLADAEVDHPPPYEVRLQALTKELKIPFRAAWRSFSEVPEPKRLYLYPYDPHPSPAGNAHLATLAAQLLQQTGHLP